MSTLEQETQLGPFQRYLRTHFHQDDADLVQLQIEAQAAGLPAISIGPEQGKFLQLLVALTGARHVLEIGTLGGYSGAWIARALPAAGRLISLEMNPRHAAFAQGQWNRLGLGATATVISGPALATLPTLTPAAPFDMIFIDADKETYPDYLEWAIRLARPGTAIVLDNVELHGRLVDQAAQDLPHVRAMQRTMTMLASDPRLVSTVVPYVDGLAVTVVRGREG